MRRAPSTCRLSPASRRGSSTVDLAVATNIYLRGIGTRSFDAGAESSVGTFVDGVYIGRSGGQLQDLVGIDRIEVLKGSQGALCGRNTIGGAINLITKKADRHIRGARLRHLRPPVALLRRHRHRQRAARLGQAVRAGLRIAQSPGRFQLATNTGQRFNGYTSDTARGRLVWQAADDSQFDLIGDYLRSNNRLGFRGSDVAGFGRPSSWPSRG